MIDSFANLAHCVAVTSAWERVANNAATEGATAPETLRSRDRTDDKTLESGFLVKGLNPADGVSGRRLKISVSVNLSGQRDSRWHRRRRKS